MPPLHKCKTDLSIIIPVYNLENYITPMLDSLKCQQLNGYKIEIIFVLNNCTDDTEGVIRRSGLKCKLIYCDIQGCGPARNAGIDIATGEYIWTIDGDDWLLTDTAILQILDRVKRDGMDILYVPFCHERYQGSYFSMTCQYVIKREFIGDIRFPHYQPAEDDNFSEKILNKKGLNKWEFMKLPSLENELYYYNFMREGSNMWRLAHGQRI